MKKISIVVPCYNEEETIPLFYNEIIKIADMLDKYKFEFIFVNDGSKDKSATIMKELAKKDERVKYIIFSKNFGKEAAIYAGLEQSSGDYVTTMDVDLQDPPSLLPQMIETIENEDYDCVATKSTSRNGYSFLRKTFTKWFYRIIAKISKTEMVAGARDYRLMTRQMVDAVINMKEYNRYSKGLFSFVGFNTKWIEFENTERVAGTTKWNFWKLFSYAIDGIVGFSTAPLIVSSIIGVIFCLISFILIIIIIIKTLIFGDPTSGWPSMVCIMFFVSGIQLFCIGIMGQYLSKIYLEVKDRPIYIIKDTNIKVKND
ncbi:MAG: glycosyltransferase family 2 protein [Romboutsia sp.]|nr:glycosyltransferase family 2 protein [Romboutsia sp.]